MHKHIYCSMLGTEAIIPGSGQVVNAVLLYTIIHRPNTKLLETSGWSKSISAQYMGEGAVDMY